VEKANRALEKTTRWSEARAGEGRNRSLRWMRGRARQRRWRRGRAGAGGGSLDGRGSMVAWISRCPIWAQVDAVTGGGGADSAVNTARRGVGKLRSQSHRGVGVGEQAGCLLGRSTCRPTRTASGRADA
jgi:hypothetical protein